MTDSAPAFMAAFGKTTTATYYPKRRGKVTGVKVIYDPETIAFDALGGGNIDVPAFIHILTSALTEKAKEGDELEFESTRFIVKQWEGEEYGFTRLSVRRKK